MNRRPQESGDFEQREAGLIQSLQQFGARIESDPMRVRGAYVLGFSFEGGQTTIRIELQDSSGADLTITHMTTLPDEKKGQGFGSQAIEQLLAWAKQNNLNNIRAVQVQRNSEKFWEKNGFAKLEGKNPTNDFVLKI